MSIKLCAYQHKNAFFSLSYPRTSSKKTKPPPPIVYSHMKILSIPLVSLFLLGCGFLCTQPNTLSSAPALEANTPLPDSLLHQRFPPPPGFRRAAADPNSFASYLRHLRSNQPTAPSCSTTAGKIKPKCPCRRRRSPHWKKRSAPMRRRDHAAAG